MPSGRTIFAAAALGFAFVLSAHAETPAAKETEGQHDTGAAGKIVLEVRYVVISSPEDRYAGIFKAPLPERGYAAVLEKKQAALLRKVAAGDRRASVLSPLPNIELEDGKSGELTISSSYDPGVLQAKFSEDRQKVRLSFTYPQDKDGKEIGPVINETVRLGDTMVLHTTQYVSEGIAEPNSFWDKLIGNTKPIVGREIQEGFFLITPRSSASRPEDVATPENLADVLPPAPVQLKAAKSKSDLACRDQRGAGKLSRPLA